MEYPEPEGTNKDHEVQLLAMHTATWYNSNMMMFFHETLLQ